jgi:hypothetical protein
MRITRIDLPRELDKVHHVFGGFGRSNLNAHPHLQSYFPRKTLGTGNAVSGNMTERKVRKQE